MHREWGAIDGSINSGITGGLGCRICGARPGALLFIGLILIGPRPAGAPAAAPDAHGMSPTE